MAANEIEKGKIWEDGGATCLSRVTNVSGSAITQATVSTISRKVFNITPGYATPDTALSTSSLTVSSVVFDTLQTDARWTKDDTGYNFRDSPAYTIFTTAGLYRVEYLFTPSSGDPFFVVFELHAQAVRTS
jgi:hypothetical protein